MINEIVSLISLADLLLLVYRNAGDLCILISYPTTLTNSLMNFSSFLVASRIFYVLYHVIWKQWQFDFFFNIDSFYFPFFSDSHGYDFQNSAK